MRTIRLPVVLCGTVWLGALGGVAGAQQPPKPKAPAPAAPAADDRRLPLDGPEAKEVDALLARFGAAMRAGDGAAGSACFDTERLLFEAKRAVPFARALDPADPAMRAGFRTGFERGLTTNSAVWSYERHALRRLERGRDGGSLIAIVRTWDRDEFATTGRWWLARGPGGWRFFDHEPLEAGLRTSVELGTTLASLLPAGLEAARGLAAAVQALLVAAAQVGENKFDDARTALEAIDPEPLTPVYRRLRLVLLASAAVGCEDAATAFTHLDALEADEAAAGGDDPIPAVHLLRGTACLLAGTLDRAEREVRTYLDRIGEDATGLQILGTIHLEAGRTADALASFRRGIADDPSNADCLVGLARTLPAGAKGELTGHVARVPRVAARFERLAEPILASEDAEALEACVAGLRSVAPEAPDVVFYGAHVRLLRKAWREAATLLAGGLARAPEDERRAWVHWWCAAMARDGKAIEAYGTAADPAGAFESLVDTLREMTDGKALASLCAAHRAKRPDDPALPLWEAEAAAFQGDHAKAVEILRHHYTAYVAQQDFAPDAENRWIRSCVGAKRFDDALAAARDSTARDGDPWYEAVVHAGKGDVDATREVLQRMKDAGFEHDQVREMCHADDIVGPALRSPAFAALRKDYPPPDDAVK